MLDTNLRGHPFTGLLLEEIASKDMLRIWISKKKCCKLYAPLNCRACKSDFDNLKRVQDATCCVLYDRIALRAALAIEENTKVPPLNQKDS